MARLAGDPARSIHAALAAHRPFFAGELDTPPATGRRPFESRHDLAVVATFLSKLTLRAALAGALGVDVEAAADAPEPRPDLDDFIRTALLRSALGGLPLVAEDLGQIDESVHALRRELGLPGMRVLQFGIADPESLHAPHRVPEDTVVYTGTHDNDTTLGWWNSTGEGDSTRAAEDVAREKAFALQYLDTDGREMNWTLIRAALASVANTVIIPMQDVLGLGSEARMNLPGRASGNWRFRFSWDQLTPDIVQRLKTLVRIYDR